ncbi:MAG TPA: hypothetical protein VK277_14670, partial [Acidimicrobiales bacterium]|nr:hypothetical protein [Acidimicrobiales bacterium]
MKGSRRKLRGRGTATVWQLRIYAGRSPASGKPVYVSRNFTGDAKAADDQLSKLVAEVSAVDHSSPSATLGSLLDRWLEKATVLKGLSPTTLREHRRTIEKIVKPTLGEVPL